MGNCFYLLCAVVPSASKFHFCFHRTPLPKFDSVHYLEETKELIDYTICVGMDNELRAEQR